MEACIRDIREWMIKDQLKIHDEKAAFILIGTQAQLKVEIDNLDIDSWMSPSSDAIRNLGAWFDTNLTMSTHVTKPCKDFFYLHNISRIRKLLT